MQWRMVLRSGLLFGGLWLAGWLALLLSGSMAVAAPPDELPAGFDYAALFTAHTGQAASPYFAAYAVLPVSETLYLGFGAGRPADIDGSLLTFTDGVTVTQAYSLSEQGFIGMIEVSGTLYIPGVDPTYADGGDLGNVYTFTLSGEPVKYRNLPNVLHTWGLWYDLAGTTLYAAVSAGVRPTTTWKYYGEVLRTTDLSLGWEQVAEGGDVGAYRTYDVISFNNELYVTWNDVYTRPCGLARSADGGQTWIRLAELVEKTACRPRLIIFNDQLLALALGQDGLYAVSADGSVTEYPFSGFTVTDWAYNYAVQDAAGRLYVVAPHGRVLRTEDLIHWETLVATDRVWVTVGYWPAHDWLILADRGPNARVWKLDLATAAAVTLPPAPRVTIQVQGDSLRLDWAPAEAAAGAPQEVIGYRVYRSTQPYFDYISYTDLLIAAPTDPGLTDDNIGGADVVGDPEFNYFYLVRAVAADGVLSLPSNHVGKFEFPLVTGE